MKFFSPDKERGFVLPVGMAMLMILSIIGIGAMRDGALQEKMSSNYVDKEKSFQAAESALRLVQRTVMKSSVEDIAATSSFHSTAEYPDSAPDYNNIDWENAGFQVAITQDSYNGISELPKVVIEEMFSNESLKTGKAPANKELAKRYFRITARGVGESDSANTVLQGVVSR